MPLTRRTPSAAQPASRLTVVLGGGGNPALAFHVGALKALQDETGLGVPDADLVIGTSAGAIVGARLASGHSVDDLTRRAPSAGPAKPMLVPRWDSRVGLVRSAVGAGLAAARNVSRLPIPNGLLAPVERVFPPGLYSVGDWESSGLAEAWPEQHLWLVTIDTVTNRRVVLRHLDDGRPEAPLVQAVSASCAVPGVFAPERIGRHLLVDGGMHSPTNVDLAARARSQVVIALAPLAYDPSLPISRRLAVPRAALNAQTRREMRAVARAGGRTLLLRPSGDDLVVRRGGHLFSQGRTRVIAERAYDTTLEQLRRPYARRLIEQVRSLLDEPAAG